MSENNGGAPLENRNATRHGLRAGRLPKGASYIRRDCDELRRTIEDCVAERNDGSVSIYHAALIQSAIRWERHAMLAQRWLRLDAENMDAATRLAYSRDVARASAERDKCLKSLGLDRDQQRDLIDALYKAPSTPSNERPASNTTNQSPDNNEPLNDDFENPNQKEK